MNRHFLLFRWPLADAYLGQRFFWWLAGVVVVSALGFRYPPLYWVAVASLAVLVGTTLANGWRLRRAAAGVSAVRRPPRVLSLGDPLPVELDLSNTSAMALHLLVIDEWPVQLQLRDHRLSLRVAAGEDVTAAYTVRPTTRGEYIFGSVNLFLSDDWGLVEWRRRVPQEQRIAVYPSLVQLRRFAFHAAAPVSFTGRRRPRPETRSYEFDQIRAYVPGDDRRTVNWKATARRGGLMVNSYATEQAQRIYCFLDKGRTMLLPFGGLSLLDHAVNASLALTNIVLQRGDRAGLLCFSDQPGDYLAADNRPDQLRRALQLLYRQREQEGESDYELLYRATRHYLPARSMVVLFTNFESNYALDRVLPVLRRMGRDHALVVVLFENPEIAALLEEPTPDAAAVYRKSAARHHLQERELMALRLRRNGVHVVLTQPGELTGAVIRRYLDLKGRGL
ncbi:uncharacterized protein (DUF58 family) [Lewinella marina]|uniref:DUF58 domain-containing protein n=1 Tax=Neolewinella marina TaxID=438751 RepID=A0A2G0CBW7_9BACT|nr:DUF58 domain-containing protein [Neolewinella marina]NJB86633.1 uncharacterized protein (DUF58 family) [Neolewinella marina]PHK97442.1 DUF58 domain-containing protein [Neolewinella marina]